MNEVKFYQGTNFWTALILAIGGLFVGFPEGEAHNIVAALFGLIASIGVIRERVKGVDLKAWITSGNTWNYIGTAVVAAVPVIPADLFTKIHEVLTAAIGGNWQGIAAGVFSIATMVYYIFKKKP